SSLNTNSDFGRPDFATPPIYNIENEFQAQDTRSTASAEARRCRTCHNYAVLSPISGPALSRIIISTSTGGAPACAPGMAFIGQGGA
ncbi:hypothetical protein ACWEO4_44540, partial [Streptomyces sp. NPDC004393]